MMARKKPIVIMFFHHWDDPAHRKNSVHAIKTVTDIYDKFGVRGHYGFVGAVLQQLAEDSPATLEKIKHIKMAIGYHGGAGHAAVGPAGHPKDTRQMAWAEAVDAMWEFETHTLDIETREPIPGKVGGYLAIQSILDIIPLPTDAKGSGAMNSPNEYVLSRMGAGSYPIKAPFDLDAVILSPMHESHLFSGSRSGGQIPTYYGKKPGEDAPAMADPILWYQTLARNLPDDQTYVITCMTHSYVDADKFEEIIRFLTSHPQDFLVSHPDVESAQWEKENSASGYYQKTYQIESVSELLDFDQPPLPGEIFLDEKEVELAAKCVLRHSLLNTHDGDFAEPPEFVDLGHRRISLANTFQAFAQMLVHWKAHGSILRQYVLPFINGPVDYPSYGKKIEPALQDKQFVGYTPMTLSQANMPPSEVINTQGLPPTGDYHMWMPVHTLARAQDMIDAASNLDLSEHVPGVIYLQLQTEDSRGESPRWMEMPVNPAEFLFGMAQVCQQLFTGTIPEYIAMVNIKIAANSQTICTLVIPGGPQDSFIMRSHLSPEELDVAWTRVPTPGEKEVMWMSLPPLGDKAKQVQVRPFGRWNAF